MTVSIKKQLTEATASALDRDLAAGRRSLLLDRESHLEDAVGVLGADRVIIDVLREPEPTVVGPSLVPISVLAVGGDVQHAAVPGNRDLLGVESRELEAQDELAVLLE